MTGCKIRGEEGIREFYNLCCNLGYGSSDLENLFKCALAIKRVAQFRRPKMRAKKGAWLSGGLNHNRYHDIIHPKNKSPISIRKRKIKSRRVVESEKPLAPLVLQSKNSMAESSVPKKEKPPKKIDSNSSTEIQDILDVDDNLSSVVSLESRECDSPVVSLYLPYASSVFSRKQGGESVDDSSVTVSEREKIVEDKIKPEFISDRCFDWDAIGNTAPIEANIEQEAVVTKRQVHRYAKTKRQVHRYTKTKRQVHRYPKVNHVVEVDIEPTAVVDEAFNLDEALN